MNKIIACKGEIIHDSRGLETIRVGLTSSNGERVFASVPQGKSVGVHEAVSVKPEIGLQNIHNIITPAILGMSPYDQDRIDERMREIDGTGTSSRLGANTMLAVSIAVARLAAREKNIPLWKHIRNLGGFTVSEFSFPRLLVNIINGGLHADNNLDFQEFLAIPKAQSIASSVRAAQKIYLETKFLLERKHNGKTIPLGDEQGFMPHFEDNEEPFAVLQTAAHHVGLGERMDYGLDAAGSNVKLKKEKLFSYYNDLVHRKQVSYIEDPFFEEDFQSFRALQESVGPHVRIVGDDLSVTNLKRMRKAKKENAITGIVIKPNQIGTLTESLAATRQAKDWGWHVIASHRSGETMDDFIADFAYGVGASGVKLGAPFSPERMAKYDRLYMIEQEARIA